MGAVNTSPEVLDWPLRRYRGPCFLLFLATWIVGALLLVSGQWRTSCGIAMGVSTALAALVGLGAGLPVQNLVGMAIVIGGLGWGMEAMALRCGFPFGRFEYAAGVAAGLPGGVPWPLLPGWVAAVVVGRGTASHLLQAYRGRPGVGFAIMGLAALLVAATDLGLQCTGAGRGGLWHWGNGAAFVAWEGIPWTRPAGVVGVAVLLLAAAFPLWINKRPVASPADPFPTVLWLFLQGFAALALGIERRWGPFALVVGPVVAVGVVTFLDRAGRAPAKRS